ncbi:MAG: GFA family protein [Devosia sp.]|nr:GFA family protein [Devosia sp.]
MEKRQRPQVDLKASCACGSVSIAVSGPIHSMFMCSCEDCQKATGSGHSTVAIADPADVAIAGQTRSFARTADSGATFTRYFCPECGTPLFGKSSRAPDAIMLPVGLFGADAQWFAPNQLIFARSHRDWDRIAEDLPRHQTYRERGRIDGI